MSNRKQLGTDYLLFVNTGTTLSPIWKIPLCQTNLVLNTPMNVIDTTSKCGPDSMVDNAQETVEFEGQILQKDATNTTHMSLFALRQLYRQKGVLEFKAGPKGETEADDGKIIYSFTGTITNLSDTYGNGDVGTVSGSINVSGQIEESEFIYTT